MLDSLSTPNPALGAPSLIHLQRVVDPLRLRLLIEVGARGSISAAADACSIGQPSASLHLRNLESAVGHRLIERDRTGSRLTPAGEIVADHGAQVLASLEQMAERLRVHEGLDSGALAVAVSTAASYLMFTTTYAFKRACPEIDVTIRVASSANVYSMVARGEVALGIGGEVVGGAEVRREYLIDDEVVGIAAPGLLGHDDGTISAGELARHTLFLLQPGSSQRIAAARVLDFMSASQAPRTWVLGSEELIKRAVRDGYGVAFLSRLAIRDEVSRHKLQTFRLRDMPRMAHPMHLVRPLGTTAMSAHDAFARSVRTACRAAEVSEPSVSETPQAVRLVEAEAYGGALADRRRSGSLPPRAVRVRPGSRPS